MSGNKEVINALIVSFGCLRNIVGTVVLLVAIVFDCCAFLNKLVLPNESDSGVCSTLCKPYLIKCKRWCRLFSPQGPIVRCSCGPLSQRRPRCVLLPFVCLSLDWYKIISLAKNVDFQDCAFLVETVPCCSSTLRIPFMILVMNWGPGVIVTTQAVVCTRVRDIPAEVLTGATLGPVFQCQE